MRCDKRFTTYERIDLKMPQIIKRNGSRTEFDRNKLVASMKLALRKRPVMAESVEAAINRIEERLLSLGERSCLPSNSANRSCASCASSTRSVTFATPRSIEISRMWMNFPK